jgi:hypothetical protein
MNSKLLLCLALGLSSVVCPQNVKAFWVAVSLNQTNIVTEAPFIHVASRQIGPTNEPIMYFTIFAALKENTKSELVSGELIIGDRHGTNAEPYSLSAPIQAREMPDGFVPKGIPKSRTGKWKAFSFGIGARLLAQSEFRVGYTIDPILGSAGTYYVLKLNEFAGKNN